MTVFKAILLHFWKYKYLILIFLTAFFTFAFGFSQNSGGQTYESEQLDLKVIDQSRSEISRGFVDYLSADNTVEVMNDSTELDALEEDIFLGITDGIIQIPSDLEARLSSSSPAVEIISDQRGMVHLQLENIVNRYFTFVDAGRTTSGTVNIEEMNTLLADGISVEMHESVDVASQNNFVYMSAFINFAGYWIMLFLLIIVGNVMSEFNTTELRQRIDVSPMQTRALMLQMITAQAIIGLFVVCFMFFGGILLRSDELEGVPLGKMFIALILITSFTLAIHYVIGAMTTNKFIINGLANFLAIGMAFLSGIMIPLELMGEAAQSIAQYLPLYHFTQIYAEPDITWVDSGFSILIVVLYTISFLIIGMILENKRKIAS
ncbi:ABC transporter permease [Salinicoccus hispanicus]|uniref:ABC transporter permease n=1 Tax=Salinicoccus hispanicus TaxID=157225 RepID=A0A6N8TZC8_9STAP|nr:ABC transporter permease [Salinicoccus hispanicus]MXQ51194.1 ABC transporter permease [Salinicoccus hispanicus]